MQTVVSLPEKLEKQVEEQIRLGKFTSKADFISFAVRTYLSLQKGEITWETLAVPFRAYAKKNRLTEKDILEAVERDRNGKTSKNR